MVPIAKYKHNSDRKEKKKLLKSRKKLQLHVIGKLVKFICINCRFDKKNASDWTIEGPRHIAKDSVIGQNLQINEKKLSNKVPDYDNKQRLLS